MRTWGRHAVHSTQRARAYKAQQHGGQCKAETEQGPRTDSANGASETRFFFGGGKGKHVLHTHPQRPQQPIPLNYIPDTGAQSETVSEGNNLQQPTSQSESPSTISMASWCRGTTSCLSSSSAGILRASCMESWRSLGKSPGMEP